MDISNTAFSELFLIETTVIMVYGHGHGSISNDLYFENVEAYRQLRNLGSYGYNDMHSGKKDMIIQIFPTPSHVIADITFL